MRAKTILLTLVGLVITVGAVSALSSIRRQPSEAKRQEPQAGARITAKHGTLEWHAQRVKAKGRDEVTIPAPMIDYLRVLSLEDAVSRYHLTVAVAQLVGERSFAEDETAISTWYKFKVTDYIARQAPSQCAICTLQLELPQEFLPLKDDEVLVLKPGGSITIDGVRVRSFEPGFPDFSRSEKYLLFLELDQSRQIATVPMGPHGAFTIDQKGAAKQVTDKRHPFKDEIEANYGGSVQRLKAQVRKKTGAL